MPFITNKRILCESHTLFYQQNAYVGSADNSTRKGHGRFPFFYTADCVGGTLYRQKRTFPEIGYYREMKYGSVHSLEGNGEELMWSLWKVRWIRNYGG
ncbi:hypothetical protein AVEN_25444-1 [Araneus ventricosus]|uniref:Uncharacterized protein n=1 Tax=Araneus ventricosus TaxID=182803 RepID=A0A4Y2TSP5_ARAVE|nr:hypothetical protein AVEN_25444-1 [Araneus ventricosus]